MIRAFNPSGAIVTLFGTAVSANSVQTIIGTTSIAAGFSNTQGTFANIRFNHGYDIQLTTEGMWVSGYTQNMVMFINNSGGGQTFGGIGIPNGEGRWVINATTNCSAFNGDENTGATTCIYNPTGIIVDDDLLWFSDISFYRLRSLDLSIANGTVRLT